MKFDADGIHFHDEDEACRAREVVRLNADGTAWVNPLAPMSPSTREAVQTLATYAASLTIAHREWRETMTRLLGLEQQGTL